MIDLNKKENTMLCKVDIDTMKNLKDFISVTQAADFLGVSAETLRRWDNANKLNSYRHPINQYRLYKKKDLEAFLRKIKQK